MSVLDFLAILRGAVATVSLSLSGIALGVPLGLALALVRWTRVPVMSPIVATYVSVMRATPAVTLALLIFFALPERRHRNGPGADRDLDPDAQHCRVQL